MTQQSLSERERAVLDAVIRTYVDTAEPAGSRTVAKRHRLGVSPATVRNTMADLEEKGYLYHPHTSAGRVPTDRAYRYYVDSLMRPVPLTRVEERRLLQELAEGDDGTAIGRLLRRAALALGVLTGELGIALAPRLDVAVLEKLELVPIAAGKILLVLTLEGGRVRTVYVDLSGSFPAETLGAVALVLNERLAGQTLRQIRETLPERLRDSAPAGDRAASELLNIFLQSADELFTGRDREEEEVMLGHASVLAAQPEFSTGTQLKSLIELTERRDLLADVVTSPNREAALQISIGTENRHPDLSAFTLVTSEYSGEGISGVIGVIGPTRMPYEKVVAIVEHTSALVSALALPRPGRSGEGD